MVDAFISNASLLGFTHIFDKGVIRYHYYDKQVLEVRDIIPLGRFAIANAEYSFLRTPHRVIQILFRDYHVKHSKLFGVETYEST
jgi:hypothetical protein